MKLERRLVISKNRLVTISLIILLLIVIRVVVNFTMGKNNGLTNPLSKTSIKQVEPSATPAYNPPKEIKYDSSSNLEEELEAINTQVLEEDFIGL